MIDDASHTPLADQGGFKHLPQRPRGGLAHILTSPSFVWHIHLQQKFSHRKPILNFSVRQQVYAASSLVIYLQGYHKEETWYMCD